MAVLTLSGVLKRPVSGEVVPNARITFDAVSTGIAVLKGVSSVCKTASDGTYSVDMEYGDYAIQVSWAGQGMQYGYIHIDETTTAGSLNDLLLQQLTESQLTPEIVLEFRHLEQQMRDQLAAMEELNRLAGESAAGAATSEANAANSENSAAVSAGEAADSAAAAATSASAIEGDAEQTAQSAAAASASAESAAVSEVNAGISERNAAISEDNAALSASESATSATEASSSEVNAETSAQDAAASAISATNSEVSAASSADEAAGSAAAAAASASAIEGDAELAAQSAVDAAVSAEAAATSAGEASASGMNAADSAKAAESSATMAADSESSAAGSASDAADSATAAAASASGAAGSEINVAGSEAAAAISATNAAVSEEGAEGAAERAEAAARSLHGVNWREEYNPAVTYVQYDAVGWLGTSYVALTDTTGNEPSEGSAFWDVLAKGFTADDLSGTLLTENNLSEIADRGEEAQEEARNNIRAVGSVNGKRPATGQSNVQLGSSDILSQYSRMNTTGGYDLNYLTSAGIQSVDSDEVAASEANSNFPVPLAGTLVVLEGETGVFQFYYVRDSSEIYTRASGPVTRQVSGERYASNWTQWAIHYTSENKPTATDVDALPIAGGNLTGKLSFLFNVPRESGDCLIGNGDINSILACAYGYYQDKFDIHFYSDAGEWESNPLSVGRNGNVTVSGNLSGGAVFDGGQRVYSPNNPQPIDLSGYETTLDANARFLQGVRLGGAGHVTNNSNVNNSAGGPAGSVVVAIWSGGNWCAVDYRPEQYLINGTWYNTGVSSFTGTVASPVLPDIDTPITLLRNFTPYQKKEDEISLVFRGVRRHARYLISEEGYDWYLASKLLAGNVFIAFDGDGIIRHVDTDATMFNPDGMSVAGLDELPVGVDIYGAWKFDGEFVYQDPDVIAARIFSSNTVLLSDYTTQAACAVMIIQARAATGLGREGDADRLSMLQNYLAELDNLTEAQLSSVDFVIPELPASS